MHGEFAVTQRTRRGVSLSRLSSKLFLIRRFYGFQFLSASVPELRHLKPVGALSGIDGKASQRATIVGAPMAFVCLRHGLLH